MAANVMFDQLGRQRKERVFRERRDPMEEMPDEEIRRRYRFGKDGITYILRQIQEKLEPKTKRSHCISAVLQVGKNRTFIVFFSSLSHLLNQLFTCLDCV